MLKQVQCILCIDERINQEGQPTQQHSANDSNVSSVEKAEPEATGKAHSLPWQKLLNCLKVSTFAKHQVWRFAVRCYWAKALFLFCFFNVVWGLET